MWKGQIPYLARHCDASSRSTAAATASRTARPRPARTDAIEYVEDAVAVLDAAGIEQACVVGLSLGGRYAALVAGAAPRAHARGGHRSRPRSRSSSRPVSGATRVPFDDELETDEGWAKFNRHYWLRDYRGFLEFFFGEMFPEPHSTKQIEDGVAWGLDTDAET